MNHDDYAPRDDWKDSPVYQKAWEISIIVERIVSIQAEDGEITEDFEMSWFILEFSRIAYQIPSKIIKKASLYLYK